MPAWTNVAKPAESSVAVASTDVESFGLLMILTSTLGTDTTSITSGWGNISKPTDTVWTNIIKPIASVGAWTNIAKPT